MQAIDPTGKIAPLASDLGLQRVFDKPVQIELADPRAAATHEAPDDLIEPALVVEPLGVNRKQIVQQARTDALHRIVRSQMQRDDERVELSRELGIDRNNPAAD